MDCERLFGLSDDQFRRSTGVKPATFEKMTAILNKAHTLKKLKGGRPNKLSIEKQLIMSLMYWREYRTYMHCSLSFGVTKQLPTDVGRFGMSFEILKYHFIGNISTRRTKIPPGPKALPPIALFNPSKFSLNSM